MLTKKFLQWFEFREILRSEDIRICQFPHQLSNFGVKFGITILQVERLRESWKSAKRKPHICLWAQIQLDVHVHRGVYDVQKANSTLLRSVQYVTAYNICNLLNICNRWMERYWQKKNVRMYKGYIELHYWMWESVLQAKCRRTTVNGSRKHCKMAASSATIAKQRALIYNIAFYKAERVSSVAGRATVHGIRRSPLSAETRVLRQRFMVKKQRGLCQIYGEEPDRPVSDLWWRTRQACVRFVVKNQRGLCQICGEEQETPVSDLWWRTREACVRFMVKNPALRQFLSKYFDYHLPIIILPILPTHPSITHQMDNGPIRGCSSTGTASALNYEVWVDS